MLSWSSLGDLKGVSQKTFQIAPPKLIWLERWIVDFKVPGSRRGGDTIFAADFQLLANPSNSDSRRRSDHCRKSFRDAAAEDVSAI